MTYDTTTEEGQDKRQIKFRVWDKENNKMVDPETYRLEFYGNGEVYLKDVVRTTSDIEIMQYTGLKDKNGVAEIYEGDILDEYGKIKGNIYQMDKGETDFVVQGFGTKDWCETYRRAILLGCKDAQ